MTYIFQNFENLVLLGCPSEGSDVKHNPFRHFPGLDWVLFCLTAVALSGKYWQQDDPKSVTSLMCKQCKGGSADQGNLKCGLTRKYGMEETQYLLP